MQLWSDYLLFLFQMCLWLCCITEYFAAKGVLIKYNQIICIEKELGGGDEMKMVVLLFPCITVLQLIASNIQIKIRKEKREIIISCLRDNDKRC